MEKEFYTWDNFEKDCDSLVRVIKESNARFKNIYGIPRGGLIPAVRLSHKLDIPLLSDKDIITKETLIIDDIADSGNTLAKLRDDIDTLTTATLFYSKNSIFKPTHYCRIKNKWVIFPWEEEKTSRYDNDIL